MTDRASKKNASNDSENKLQTIDVTESLLAALQEKAKANGKTVEDLLEVIAFSSPKSNSRTQRRKETTEAASDGEKSFVLLGPFGARKMTRAALREETDRENLRASVLEEIRRSADRSTGIVGGAFVEDGLGRLIKACWRDGANTKRDKSVEDIFEPQSALGSFSVKNKVAYMCRIIGPLVFSDLELIREIRNKCAHWMTMDKEKKRADAVTFEHSELRKRCDRLQYGKKTTMEFSDGEHLRPTTPRNKFILTVLDLGQQLHGCADLVSQGMTQDKLTFYLH